jgi:hypothetical protein
MAPSAEVLRGHFHDVPNGGAVAQAMLLANPRHAMCGAGCFGACPTRAPGVPFSSDSARSFLLRMRMREEVYDTRFLSQDWLARAD